LAQEKWLFSGFYGVTLSGESLHSSVGAAGGNLLCMLRLSNELGFDCVNPPPKSFFICVDLLPPKSILAESIRILKSSLVL